MICILPTLKSSVLIILPNRYLAPYIQMVSRLPLPKLLINDLTPRLLQKYSKVEKESRCKLASAYRLISYFGWDDVIYGHTTMRLPDDTFLINPFGLHYSEVSASNLVKVDLAGNIVDPGTTNFGVNKAGYVLHSAIHEARQDLHAVMHIHSREGMAVSCLPLASLPIVQTNAFILPISSHPYEGLAVRESEKLSLAADFKAPSKVLLLENHGLLAGGSTIEECMFKMYHFHQVCTAIVDSGAHLKPCKTIRQDILDETQRAADIMSSSENGVKEFEAWMRQLDYAGLKTSYPYSFSKEWMTQNNIFFE